MSEKTDYAFTINLLGVYIKELHARDLGGYPEEKS